MKKRSKAPSRAINWAGLGALVGVAVDVAAAVYGVTLPPGTGAAVSGALALTFGYSSRGGRKGEAD